MSNYDLDLFLDETYTLKFGEEKYELPKQPKTGFLKKLTALQMKIKDVHDKDPLETTDLMTESVSLILGQDQSKKVTKKFVEENLTPHQMQKIVEIFFNEVKKIEEKN